MILAIQTSAEIAPILTWQVQIRRALEWLPLGRRGDPRPIYRQEAPHEFTRCTDCTQRRRTDQTYPCERMLTGGMALVNVYDWLPSEALKILLVLFFSFLIGLEREEHKAAAKYYGFGGVRAFPLIRLIGYSVALLSGTQLLWLRQESCMHALLPLSPSSTAAW
jgi:hypothetical protein